MKRDMELVRKILIQVEDASFNQGWVDLKLPDYADELISYHVMLLHQAGLLEGLDLSTMDGREWKPKWLTWEGQEFLEASRNEGRWKKTISLVKDKGGGMVFEVIKTLLIDAAKRAVLPP